MSYKGFKIICLGTYCLPRVIATACHYKSKKIFGEKTCPFDLAFCWDFDSILDNLNNEFSNFFKNIKYDYITNEKLKKEICEIFSSKLNAKFWKNDSDGFIFNHEIDFSFEELKSRYIKRINNFYEYLHKQDQELYFLIASFKPITDKQIEMLNNIILRYRKPNSFFNIILNQSNRELDINIKNTYVINCYEYNQLFRGDWSLMIKDHDKYIMADKFYKLVDASFRKIILKCL